MEVNGGERETKDGEKGEGGDRVSEGNDPRGRERGKRRGKRKKKGKQTPKGKEKRKRKAGRKKEAVPGIALATTP
ncbi:hypothetical protein P170DRAFT_208995 [Aspergillus steynii IBT 23096]|uniref:Uncharacterized protein n=1 Tax=Aspergillus steynii IBT 23096 TaxID=1392250 RepID=A0A2I2G5U2_9EURO|nr:uncharacterized protein P170DRAFT_208995 [Aspergillus steynii IBT 23096]PLB48247.1 hypothetical protein P170DRAFT_208995 [Aspergillus steynii IBT 23096]